MLEMRTQCEHCNKALPNESDEAMICTFECTFCSDCVTEVLENVCPNCGGGFEQRPSRPKAALKKHPMTQKIVLKPINEALFEPTKEKQKGIAPRQR